MFNRSRQPRVRIIVYSMYMPGGFPAAQCLAEDGRCWGHFLFAPPHVFFIIYSTCTSTVQSSILVVAFLARATNHFTVYYTRVHRFLQIFYANVQFEVNMNLYCLFIASHIVDLILLIIRCGTHFGYGRTNS